MWKKKADKPLNVILGSTSLTNVELLMDYLKTSPMQLTDSMFSSHTNKSFLN